MKNISYFSMIATALLTLGACSNNNLLADDMPYEAADDYNGFTATIGEPLEILEEENLDGEAMNTRSTFTDGAFSAWSTTDKISVSDGTLNYTYHPDADTEDERTSFVAKEGGNSFTPNGESTFYAFYPANAVLGWNGSTVTTMIYTEQKHSENINNSGVMGPYMAAIATTTGGGANASFTFGHICSVIDVDLSSFDGGEVESVALYANSQVSIAGRMKYDASNKSATVITLNSQPPTTC